MVCVFLALYTIECDGVEVPNLIIGVRVARLGDWNVSFVVILSYPLPLPRPN